MAASFQSKTDTAATDRTGCLAADLGRRFSLTTRRRSRRYSSCSYLCRARDSLVGGWRLSEVSVNVTWLIAGSSDGLEQAMLQAAIAGGLPAFQALLTFLSVGITRKPEGNPPRPRQLRRSRRREPPPEHGAQQSKEIFLQEIFIIP